VRSFSRSQKKPLRLARYRYWAADAFKGLYSGDFVINVREKLKVTISMVERLDSM
jgi:hypothetical protein